MKDTNENGNKPRIESGTHPEVAFCDARGDIINVLDRPVSHVALITSKAGSIRGNHYHPKDEQYMYVLSGSFESLSRDLNINPTPSATINVFGAGDLVYTPPMVAHANRYLEDTTCVVMTIDSRESDRYEEHTVKFQVVDHDQVN